MRHNILMCIAYYDNIPNFPQKIKPFPPISRLRQKKAGHCSGSDRPQRVKEPARMFRFCGKKIEIMFPGGVYLGEHTAQPESVEFPRQ